MVSLIHERNERSPHVRLAALGRVFVALYVPIEQLFHMAIILQLHLLPKRLGPRNDLCDGALEEAVAARDRPVH